MSHREVGHALGMRPEMAAKTLSRAKENIAQFNDWPDKWLEKHPQKVSSVQAWHHFSFYARHLSQGICHNSGIAVENEAMPAGNNAFFHVSTPQTKYAQA